MPKRTNAFQDLIELLERQLAPTDAMGFASRLLMDCRTGQKREVDIIIETHSGIHPLKIGIEVVDRRRPASSTWIEQVAKKHEDLPIDKSIVVSRSGFYRPALEKAHALKIETLTVEDACEMDWSAKIHDISWIELDSFVMQDPIKVTVVFSDEGSAERCRDLDLLHLVLYSSSGEPQGNLSSVLQGFLNREDVIEEILGVVSADTITAIEGQLRFTPGSYILARDDKRHAVYSLAFKATCRRRVIRMDLQKGSYGGVATVLASGDSLGHPVSIAFSEQPEDDPIVSARIRKGSLPTRTHNPSTSKPDLLDEP
jgi:hypothetical protein